MILECPQCGFVGRVPDRASPGPRKARCPKCRRRFDVDVPDAGGDPEDSSYELAPIADGDPSADSWYDDPDEARSRTGREPPPKPKPRPPRRVVRVPRPATLRIRLFQAWAVFFMAWAAAIAARAALVRFDDARFFSNEPLRPVAAVVVLVCGAALLCFYVDLSRRLSR